MVMVHPLVQDPAQMVDGQRHQKVEALPPQRTDEPLAQRISLRALWGCFEDLES